jgi:hypothetical protein
MTDANWARWIVASVADYFQSVADSLSLPLLVETADEREEENLRAMNHAELRVNGPAVQEVSKNYHRLWVDINILVSALTGEAQQNAYDLIRYVGEFQNAATQPIPIFKYGDGPDDDDSQIGCLTKRRGISEAVSAHHFGQLGKTERLRQSAVDGRYEMYLST